MQQHPREIAGHWLDQAKRDLDGAAYLVDGQRYEMACFACQQSAEKALTAALIWLAGDRPRTHVIESLIEELAKHRDDARAQLAECQGLDPYYVSTRYPDAVGGGIPGAKFFKADAELALVRAARAIAFADKLLPAVS